MNCIPQITQVVSSGASTFFLPFDADFLAFFSAVFAFAAFSSSALLLGDDVSTFACSVLRFLFLFSAFGVMHILCNITRVAAPAPSPEPTGRGPGGEVAATSTAAVIPADLGSGGETAATSAPAAIPKSPGWGSST